MLSKRALTKGYGLQAVIASALMVLVFLLAAPGTGMGASHPTTAAELALYQGPDREQILIEGAKKEGKVTLYTSNAYLKDVLPVEFPKKYPFIKVEVWRGSGPEHLKRVIEESRAKHYIMDVSEINYTIMAILAREGILQEYYSPELRTYPDEVIKKGAKGVYFCVSREIYIGLGFNTKLISPAEAPKTYEELLDPKWKGKMSIAGTDTGVDWIGNVMETKGLGRDFVEKLTRQNPKVQNVSGTALAGMVVSGEVPLSPTIFNSNVIRAKEAGGPIEWRPLEPVFVNVSYSGIAAKAPHPHAGILLNDYLLSKEGQQLLMKGGLSSGRTDIGSLEAKFKKNYLEAKYPLEVYEQKVAEWEKLRSLFIKKQ